MRLRSSDLAVIPKVHVKQWLEPKALRTAADVSRETIMDAIHFTVSDRSSTRNRCRSNPSSFYRPPSIPWHADGKLPNPTSKLDALGWTARMPVMEPKAGLISSQASKRPEMGEAAPDPTYAVGPGMVTGSGPQPAGPYSGAAWTMVRVNSIMVETHDSFVSRKTKALRKAINPGNRTNLDSNGVIQEETLRASSRFRGDESFDGLR